MAVGLTGPGPDPQNQKNVICRHSWNEGHVHLVTDANSPMILQYPLGSRILTVGLPLRKTILKELHMGTPRGTPRGEALKKASKDKRPKSPKPT